MVESHFGKLAVQRGRAFDFLGMNIKFKDDGTFSVGLQKHIEKAIETFGEDVSGDVS